MRQSLLPVTPPNKKSTGVPECVNPMLVRDRLRGHRCFPVQGVHWISLFQRGSWGSLVRVGSGLHSRVGGEASVIF